MRFPSWRATQPQDPADRAKLQERLTRLTTPPVLNDVPAPSVVTAPISTARAKLQELTGAGAPTSPPITPVPAETKPPVEIPVPATPAVAPELVLAVAPISAAVVDPVVALVPYSAPVLAATPITVEPNSRSKSDRRRRRKFGFLLFFAGLIVVFFVVRAIPGDWEIGPFRIDATGSAGDSASLYYSDDPHAPFWLLVPTFNLPPRFFAARPNSSARPIVALAPSPSHSPSASASTSASAGPSSSPPPSARPSA